MFSSSADRICETRPLIERKRLLRSITPEQPSVLLYAKHIERNGVEFFR
jgi:hypothetical protein